MSNQAPKKKRRPDQIIISINGSKDYEALVKSVEDHSFVTDLKYDLNEVISEDDTYVVAVGQDRNTGCKIEMKKYFDPLRYNSKIGLSILRELKVYNNFNIDTSRIVRLMDIMLPVTFKNKEEGRKKIFNSEFKDVYLVFESLEHDLAYIINKKLAITKETKQWLLTELLSSVSFLHSKKIVHRDLRPSNIFVNLDEKVLKIRSFGLSKIPDDKESSDGKDRREFDVGTKQGTAIYSAPELILGYGDSTSVDIWSVGCIFAEILKGEPLFFLPTGIKPNKCTKMDEIVKILKNKSLYLDQVCSDRLAIDLLEKMLDFDPSARISAEDAKKHSYFKEEEAEAEEAAEVAVNLATEVVADEDFEDSDKAEIRKLIWNEMKAFTMLPRTVTTV